MGKNRNDIDIEEIDGKKIEKKMKIPLKKNIQKKKRTLKENMEIEKEKKEKKEKLYKNPIADKTQKNASLFKQFLKNTENVEPDQKLSKGQKKRKLKKQKIFKGKVKIIK